MSTFARITDGVAVEVWTDGGLGIVPADVFVPGLAEQFEPVPDEVQAGWFLLDDVWNAPPEYPSPLNVPQEVTMRQAKLALHYRQLLHPVNTAIQNSEDEVTKIEWEYAQTVRRDWPALISLANEMQLTEDEVDNLFIFASTL